MGAALKFETNIARLINLKFRKFEINVHQQFAGVKNNFNFIFQPAGGGHLRLILRKNSPILLKVYDGKCRRLVTRYAEFKYK